MFRCAYEKLKETAGFLKKRIAIKPLVGIICGSGLGGIAGALSDTQEFTYDAIPNFPVSTVDGHAGKLVFGNFGATPAVCMQGRFHYYEGYPLWKCVLPVRVMKLLGAKYLIVTNAAGALNQTYRVGDVVLVKDHINIMGFAGNTPLQGPNLDRLGPRFFPMTRAYDRDLLRTAKRIAEDLGISEITREGVITCVAGPNFETVAEMRALTSLGADVVGMSTVHEAVAARHCGLALLAFSLITNMCIMDYDNEEETNHEAVVDVGEMRAEQLRAFVGRVVEHIGGAEGVAKKKD